MLPSILTMPEGNVNLDSELRLSFMVKKALSTNEVEKLNKFLVTELRIRTFVNRRKHLLRVRVAGLWNEAKIIF